MVEIDDDIASLFRLDDLTTNTILGIRQVVEYQPPKFPL